MSNQIAVLRIEAVGPREWLYIERGARASILYMLSLWSKSSSSLLILGIQPLHILSDNARASKRLD